MEGFTGDIMENPYTIRSPVKSPEGFYGRDEVIGRILNDIVRKQMQSRCIIGERKIGKTSLLYQIMNSQVQEKYVGKVESSIFVTTDITFFPDEPPATFFKEWAKVISQVSGQLPPEELEYLAFRRFVESVTETGYKIIIFLDEFEATAANSSLDRGFFQFLRALTQHYSIAFILFSRTPLHYFLREEKYRDKFGSPFFNALNISYLRFLEESEAKRLIIEPAQKVGVDITEFTDFILKHAYYHPFLLQLLSSIVFDFNQSSNTEKEKILEEFRIQTEEFFDYLWKHSDLDEQETLKKLASQDQDIPRLSLDKLDRRSLLTQDKSKIFCPTFEEFIKSKI
jgi:hypothetical protein